MNGALQEEVAILRARGFNDSEIAHALVWNLPALDAMGIDRMEVARAARGLLDGTNWR